MGILELFIVILVIGLIVYLIQQYAPIPQAFKAIVLVVGIIVVLYEVLKVFNVKF